jgi:hypothetical protein
MRNQTPLLFTAAALCALTTGAAQAQVTQTVLHVFGSGSDGAQPSGNLLADNTGPSGTLRGLYGTAIDGANDTCGDGCGTVFKLTPPKAGHANWKESSLWSFTGGADGEYPVSPGCLRRRNGLTLVPLSMARQAPGAPAMLAPYSR